ncbi:hypothetical protein NDU88_006068 [Pleurodeles waltl]|uniref:Uncharacterized protein n=1 Tax=Pleurodeles waltl TaxID=8319 RepID=A0AAV7LTS0_PLEWA|nr:hypothetical protein NDU88_006068 [Pleurodeles waltl]
MKRIASHHSGRGLPGGDQRKTVQLRLRRHTLPGRTAWGVRGTSRAHEREGPIPHAHTARKGAARGPPPPPRARGGSPGPGARRGPSSRPGRQRTTRQRSG